jgi:phosphonate transport system substrate-binding protein
MKLLLSNLRLVALAITSLFLINGCQPSDPSTRPAVEQKADVPKEASTLDTYVVGIVPQQSASKLAKLWIPILDRVGKKANVILEFETAKTIPEFEKRCADGLYDIAYMNPYHYTVFHEKPGYEAFAKQQDKQIQGILVKKKDTPLTQLEDLSDSTLAFPAPRAFAATLLTRAALDGKNIDYKTQFVSSHDSVYRGVAKGLFPAGGGIIRTFKGVDPSIQDQLEILWKTPKYTPHAFAFHPRVTQEMRLKISEQFLALTNTEDGTKELSSINFKGIETADDEDWNDVRSLNITVE